ncbi:peptidase [Streptomyces pluripotens]|uniref:Peptidase n=1 Tax=Streptomyces pluripotens TaxID=1355015 RepID=A0A221P2M0_9ACTN|nr:MULTISPECIES: Clp protease N-terminal domain-containing protein [Streptomyces]ARP72264.1 peptidase [Streptomyces pluripotens]ASN26513.1 peptidase [Streptomyces pluripotens]MCH0556146.1 peptidase [Streptomyces sp. MUM 16J]
MFERFTKDARSVVDGAVGHAEESRAGQVRPEHLLLALFDPAGGRAAFALSALGLPERREEVRWTLAEARRRAGLTQVEATALAGLGIDVSEVVARVEEVHGVGAMSGGRGAGGWRPGRRLSFSRGAKSVLERSLREALARHDRHIGDDHLLLALTVLPGVAAEALAEHGVTYEAVVRVLYGGGAKAG